MPVSVKSKGGAPYLRVPQLRVLRALMPSDPTDEQSEWPTMTRANLAVNAGYTAISGTINRALKGIGEGSSSGDPHPGLLQLKLIETLDIDVEGIIEVNWRITPEGVRRYLAHVEQKGEELPKNKLQSTCINERYLKEDRPEPL